MQKDYTSLKAFGVDVDELAQKQGKEVSSINVKKKRNPKLNILT